MPRRDWRAFLEDIVVAARDVREFTDGVTFEQYSESKLLRAAVERRLLTLGEAVNQLRKLRPDKAELLGDVRGVVDFRNILVHGYFGIRDDKVWDAVQHDIPPLLAITEPMLKEELDKLDAEDDPT